MSYMLPTRLESFDQVLGPREARYLADGYRRVQRTIVGATIESDGGRTTVTAMGRASYPKDWSTKGAHGPLVPHLSSIDVLAFGEALLQKATSRLAAPAGPARAVRITTATLRAGARAHLRLDEIPLQCVVSEGARPGAVSARCLVGSLVVDLTADVGPADDGPSWTPREGLPSEDGEILDPPGIGWSSFFEPIAPESVALEAVHIPDPELFAGDSGCVTAVDLLSLSAQQAQLLIYNSGGVTRADTDTMWMRTARFVVPARRVLGSMLEMRLEISRSRVLQRGGQVWHLHDVRAETSNGASASASLAYRSQPVTG